MLKLRVLTAIVLLPIVIGLVLFASTPVIAVVLGAILAGGAWEWSALAGLAARSSRVGYVLAFLALIAPGFVDLGHGWYVAAVVGLGLIWWLFSIWWIIRTRYDFPSSAKAVFGLLTLVPAWAALVALHALDPEKVLYVLVLIWAADIGAYFCGRAFGRHRLAPLVSPGKTWEGVFGGMFLAGAVAIAGADYFSAPVAQFVLLGLLVAAISVVGDLSESLLKRLAGVKDSGHILPGHGGILDRIDSLTAAAPAFLVGLSVLEYWQ